MLDNPLAQAVLAAKDEISVEIADTPDLVREAYRLRHQVYCVENNYETGRDGMEFDEFDMHSRHAVVRRNSPGELVGSVRLVLPRRDALREALPMLRVCDPAVLRHVPLQKAGEVSRFAISKVRRA